MRSPYSASSPVQPSALGDQSASAKAWKDRIVDTGGEGEEDEQEETQDLFQ